MRKKVFCGLIAVAMTAVMVGCGRSTDVLTGDATAIGDVATDTSDEMVALTVWVAAEDLELTNDIVEKFKIANPDQDFDIRVAAQAESTVADTILDAPAAAADIFAFTDGQIVDLVNEKVLHPVLDMDVETITRENFGSSIEAASVDGILYAYPFAVDNGYFMYYDSRVITDASSWDAILNQAEAGGKKVGMTLASGWYNAGFFYGAGFTTQRMEDGSTILNWNETSADGISGVDVAQAMLDIAAHPAFRAIAEGSLAEQAGTGEYAAIIAGIEDAGAVQEAFGEGYAAAVLPTYTCADKQVQMGSAAGYKLIGVNAHSKNVGWAMELAKYLTNADAQSIRFAKGQLVPSNVAAAESDDVKGDIAIATVCAQNEAYGVIQSVGDNYGEPTSGFGETIAQGNPDRIDLQELLDELVAAVAQPVQ